MLTTTPRIASLYTLSMQTACQGHAASWFAARCMELIPTVNNLMACCKTVSTYFQPLGRDFIDGVHGMVVQATSLHMADDVEAALLDVVDEVHELAGLAGVGHHQQDLGPPVLHVGFAGIQHQQVLANLHIQHPPVLTCLQCYRCLYLSRCKI